jgi:hypothetical protein
MLEQIEQVFVLPVNYLFIANKNIGFLRLDKSDDKSAERDQIRQERQKERQRAATLQRTGGDKR